jgi:hypothetical protein
MKILRQHFHLTIDEPEEILLVSRIEDATLFFTSPRMLEELADEK